MKTQQLHAMLEAMAATPGVDGCALVEIDAGMVWHACGAIGDEPALAEAASDYWRLYRRLNGHFSSLGELRATVMVHAQGRLTLLPCGAGRLLVAVSSQQNPQVDWRAWQLRVIDLARQLDQA